MARAVRASWLLNLSRTTQALRHRYHHPINLLNRDNIRTSINLRAVFAALIFAFGFYTISMSPERNIAFARSNLEILTLETRTGVHRFEIEVARTFASQAKGLMFRRSIPENYGMLFVHEKAQELSMWMKNTYISLDMVFIRKDGVVHHIEKNTEPFSLEVIGSDGPVSAVLELNAGTADKIGLIVGDKVRHGFFKP